VDEDRRRLIKLGLIGGAIAIAGGGAALALHDLFPGTASAGYPKVQLYYDDGTPILASQYRYSPTDPSVIVFDYPLTNEPNMLINLGAPGPNGAGPQQSLVAFSALCQHLGCQPPSLSYYPPGTCGSYYGGRAIIHCVCHGSTYDPAVAAPGGGATLVVGPALVSLPQTVLEWDGSTDFLYAVGVLGPPVFGHTNTLEGGSTVPPTVEAAAPLVPIQQCPS
jgi:Rieske Fe-S protein